MAGGEISMVRPFVLPELGWVSSVIDLFAVYFDVLCFYGSKVLILGFGFIFFKLLTHSLTQRYFSR